MVGQTKVKRCPTTIAQVRHILFYKTSVPRESVAGQGIMQGERFKIWLNESWFPMKPASFANWLTVHSPGEPVAQWPNPAAFDHRLPKHHQD